MTQLVGRMLGHYRLGEPLGAGGMGVVYRARDTRLERDVAIKVLPATTLGDEAARARFRKEALALARLSHPHIGTVFDFNTEDGIDFLVMELVAGESLDRKIAGQPLPEKEVVALGVQIASALEEAHEQRIIHRDLKPSNILVTPRGQAKVLDFGLARLLRPEGHGADLTATVTEAPGVAGTLPYMAPEQLRAQPADARSDIWALGVVLYEMAAGARPFQGQSGFEVSAAILNEPPAPLPARIGASLRAVIERCLEKDPGRRYQRAGEVRAALETIQTGAGPAREVRRSIRWPRWAWVTGVAVLLIAVSVTWQLQRPGAPAEPLEAISLTTLPGVEAYPSFSPGGDHVAFTWRGSRQDNQDIYVQLIGSGSPLRLTTDPLDDYNPAWSPDGRWIAFFRGASPAPTGQRRREVRLIPALGGPERKLADVRGQDFPGPSLTISSAYLTWSADSTALVVTDSPGEGQPDALFVVSVDTGETRQLTHPQSPVLADTSPAVSADGQSLVFLRRTSWGSGELHLLPLGDGVTAAGDSRRLTPPELRADYPAWMPDGNEIIFSAKGALWRLRVSGENTPVRVPYVGDDGLMPAVSRAQPGRLPRLIYVRSVYDTNFWRIETSAPGAPSTSAPVRTIASTKAEYHSRFSPDGRRVAFGSQRSGEREIWTSDPDGSNATQVTFMNAQETMCPYWSPDGELMTFSSNPDGEFDIFVVPAAGGKPRRLTSHPAIDICSTFSRDGRWIYFSSTRSGDYRVWKMPAAGGDAVQVTPNQGGGGAIEMPDGSLYYNEVSVVSSVWRLPAPRGEPEKVLDGVVWFNYSLLEHGAYYIDRMGDETRLQYRDFASGKTTTVANNLGEVHAGLSTAPDGRTILFNRLDASADDLMLVENFR